MVWGLAVPLLHSQFIQLSLSDPEQRIEEEDWNAISPWKHLFFSSRPTIPSLLHTCRDSRQVTQAFYTQGWHTRADGFGWGPSTLERDDPIECDIGEELEVLGNKLYWRPETDAVLIRHEEEPFACDETSICNAENSSYGFYFDDQVRFVVMARDVFESGIERGFLTFESIQILFVLVDKPRKDAILAEIGISDHFIEQKFERVGRAAAAGMV